MAKVEIENVHKNYGAKEDAVKGASFTCEDGELVVLLGPSGCGKTTTLRMITGLETITSGTIKVGGKVVNDLTPQQRNVAMAFETYALYPPLTVYDNIAFPLHVMNLTKAEVDKRVRKVAESLSITEILNNYPDSLAGGQKQRVSLARALVREPTVFLMDEPLSHVDADVRYRARAEIKHMQVTSKATVIYVTHDQVEAVALADRVIVMDLGVIQQIGTPVELFNKPANLFVAGFIGEPPMNLIPSKLDFSNEKMHLAFKSNEQKKLSYAVNDLPSNAKEVLKKHSGKDVVVGIRPQKLRIVEASKSPESGFLLARMVVHEFLGKNGIAQVEVNPTMLECVTPPVIPYNTGDNVGIIAPFEDLNIFDSVTTQRIPY
jgi:multiple sugar transport system ATP-binding protein